MRISNKIYLGTMPTMPQHNEKVKTKKMKTELQTSKMKQTQECKE